MIWSVQSYANMPSLNILIDIAMRGLTIIISYSFQIEAYITDLEIGYGGFDTSAA